ncbi:MAG: YdcF family protein [Myxococcota bacterium]
MRRLLYATTVVLLAHVGFVTVEGFTADPAPADVAVVLGTTVNPDGTLSRRLEPRVEAARALYEAGVVKRILVSGAVGEEGVDEAVAMRDWLVARGVPRRHVLVDSEGFDTWHTAENARARMSREGLETAVAVSSWYHLSRTTRALEKAGVEVVGAQRAALVWAPKDAWSVVREVAALYAYRAKGRV